MNRCPLFVELCAGTVAVSLRLQGGNRCRPVVSRMGAKTGYANIILACFGLTPGGKADAYLWCEPDPGARLLLQALPQSEVLQEAASVLRGWASQDPRTLWEALREEGPPKGCDGREVARWALVTGQTWEHKKDGRPIGQWTFKPQQVATPKGIAALIDRSPLLPPTTITDDAREIDPPLLPVGTVCLIDPPYVQTTGYGHELSRAEVVRLARLWADAGAFVGVCEQEPIPELVGEGWHSVDITHGRRGQKRTFSRQQREYLTLSRAPVNPPLLGEQVGLWT